MFARRLLVIVVLVLAAGLVFFDLSAYRPFRLGLDLRGGSHLVYEANTSQLLSSDIGPALSSLREVIERRINAFGVTEPVIQTETVGFGEGA